ncbi:MAG: adenylyltransferase/cytidyltransferase family protein, partial [Acetobacteraceae bacterium]|nr:adenylyltransferase/cytidyltransferase family protein [Acetobacteraceae bacterium]
YGRYAGADVAIPSRRLLARATGFDVSADTGVEAAAEELRRRHGFGAVVVTRAEHGMTLVNDEGAWHFRAEAAEVFDVSGAGDTAVATLAAALATGADLPLAAQLANVAAGVVVGKVGIAVAREGDLLAAISEQGGAQRKIVARDVAAERTERWRRTGLRTGFVRGCFDQLRPGHLHMLEQARAACDRLVVGLSGDGVCERRHKETAGPRTPVRLRADALAHVPSIDLVVIDNDDSPEDLLNLLRPDVLIGGNTQADIAGADLVQTWGGRVLLADRLAEPAGD